MAGHPETQLPGLMSIADTGRVEVTLSGNFGGYRGAFQGLGLTVVPPATDDEYLTPKRICGKVLDGGLVTLDECDYWVPRVTIGGPSGGSSTSIVHPKLTLVGAEYSEQEEILFTEFGFSVEGLDTWLSVSGIRCGIEVEEDTGIKTGSIRFRPPEGITVTLSNGETLELRFSISSPSSSIPMTEVTVKQTARVFVQTKEPQPVSYFSSIAHRFCNFLSLALDQNVCIESLTGYLPHEAESLSERKYPIGYMVNLHPGPTGSQTFGGAASSSFTQL